MRLLLLVFLSIAIACNNHSRPKKEIILVVDEIRLDKNGDFQIQEQFLGKKCKYNKKYASAYLCIERLSGDTIWIISPCLQLKYNENSYAKLYFDSKIKIGDTLLLKIDEEKVPSFNKQLKYFGSLRIPMQ